MNQCVILGAVLISTLTAKGHDIFRVAKHIPLSSLGGRCVETRGTLPTAVIEIKPAGGAVHAAARQGA